MKPQMLLGPRSPLINYDKAIGTMLGWSDDKKLLPHLTGITNLIGTSEGYSCGAPNVNLYTDTSDAANIIVGVFGGTVPGNTVFHNTGSCGHNIRCILLNNLQAISQSATDCDVGGGSVFGVVCRLTITFQTYGPSFNTGFTSLVVFLQESQPVPSVTSTIKFHVE